MQRYLENLTALHSSELQAQGSRAAGRPVRRDPITTEHPIIRTHPVTGWKSLFFNPGFVIGIVGVPKTESDAIIRYLNEVISTTPELHVRFQWRKHDVAFWDNRISVRHSCFPTSALLICPESFRIVWICPSSSSCCSCRVPCRAPNFRSRWNFARGGSKCSLQSTKS